jgi:AcrR family transcriptional regulator
MVKATAANEEQRKKDILDAALYCFLHFGYAKTSMDDVAKRAKLSRPLIYLKFKNKEDLLLGLFDHIMSGRVEETEHLVDDISLCKREKLTKAFESLALEPWSKIAGFPMSQEFFSSCSMCEPKSMAKFDKHKLKLVTAILGDKALAEVFVLALDGQMEDLPSTAVLRKRIEILIDRFTR